MAKINKYKHMKTIFVKMLFTATIILSIAACNSQQKKETIVDAESTATTTVHSDDPDFTKGEGIVLGSDCATCHKPDLRVSGPSYAEIADKYAADPTKISMLAGKIIKGGKGVWGETAMTPHPNMSQQDAEATVKYIYYFKTK
jgi:cytochrome c